MDYIYSKRCIVGRDENTQIVDIKMCVEQLSCITEAQKIVFLFFLNVDFFFF